MLLAGALAFAGCAGCKNDPPASPTSPAGPSAAWLSGTLPPEALQGTPVRGGTLVVRLAAEPAVLNRLHDAGQDGVATRAMLGQVHETLLQLDRDDPPNHPLIPSLAERWELSADGLTTTFHLREGVRFHDGQRFTAKDVTAVLDAVMDERLPTAALRGSLPELAGYDAPDERTVVLRWKRPSPVGLRSLAIAVPIMPASALEGDFEGLPIHRAPVGTGPFRFAGWEPGKELVLARNDAYWGPKAHLDKVVFRFAKDPTVAAQRFERGEFDLMTSIPPAVWKGLEAKLPQNAWAHRGYHRIRYPENSYAWIGWNARRPFFGDAKLRTALTHLVPTEAIFEHVTLGLEPTTTCPFFSEGPWCDPALQADDSPLRLRHDPAKGRALLAQSGWRDSDGDGVLDKDGVPFRFTFLVYAHSAFSGKVGPLVQEAFRKAGIEVELERLEWAAFMKRVRQHDFDAMTLAWSTVDVENDVFATFHSSQVDGGANYVSYANPQVDRLLERSRATFDPGERTALHRELHRALYADQVYTFLGARTALDAVKTRVRGLRPSVAWYRFSEVWLAPAP